jgi:hypothetical protein
MPARTRPTPEQRTDRARVAVIVLGSVIAALHLLPALVWSASADRQQCLDDAITNQAVASCNHATPTPRSVREDRRARGRNAQFLPDTPPFLPRGKPRR